MSFTEPLWFLLALPALVHAGVALRAHARLAPVLLRLLALLALCTAAAGPAPSVGRAARVVFAVDGSASVPRAARARAAAAALAWAEGLDPTTEVRGLIFGGGVREVSLKELEASARAGSPGGTDVAGALHASGRLAGPGGSVVLLSDGRARDLAAARRAAAGVRQAGARLDVAPVWGGLRDVWVESVSVPSGLRQGATAPVTAVVRSTGGGAAGVLVWTRDGEPVGRARFEVTGDGAASSTFAVTLPDAGRRELRVHLEEVGEQVTTDNDAGGALARVVGAARVLHLARPRDGDLLGPRLVSAGHSLTRSNPSGLVLDAATLAAWDLVVVDDVPVSALPRGADTALADYARAGGGLLFVGGPNACGPGGYAGTALDTVSPLQADRRRAGGRLASVLLLDKSGSMSGDEGGWERLLLGKATIRSLLRTFRHPEDRVGVLGYDSGPVVVLPMTRVAEVRPEFVDTGGLHPAGGTNPVPALRLAEKWLGDAGRYPMRHVVLVSDGRFPGVGAEEAVRRLAGEGIRVSAVAVGTAADTERLTGLAGAGGGSFTPVADLQDLPAVVARELLAATGEPLREEQIKVEVGPDLAGIIPTPLGAIPPLQGLVSTALRQDAHLWLVASTGAPILAGVRQGAGRSAALATDLTGRWSAAWGGWEGLGRVVDALVAWAARRGRGPWEASVREAEDGSLVAEVDAVDGAGRPVAGLEPHAVLDIPGGGRQESAMRAWAPGRYRARFAAPSRGVVELTVLVDGAAVARAGLLHLAPAELRDRGDDAETLGALAEAGGGAVLGNGAALPPPAGRMAPGTPRRSLPLLLGLALLLLYVWREGSGGRRAPRE